MFKECLATRYRWSANTYWSTTKLIQNQILTHIHLHSSQIRPSGTVEGTHKVWMIRNVTKQLSFSSIHPSIHLLLTHLQLLNYTTKSVRLLYMSIHRHFIVPRVAYLLVINTFSSHQCSVFLYNIYSRWLCWRTRFLKSIYLQMNAMHEQYMTATNKKLNSEMKIP